MTEVETKIENLFDELVPPSGKADTVAGEIIRAITRISYRNYNDGDHIGVGYGNETCNPPARYLMKKTNDNISQIILDMWGVSNDKIYDAAINALENAILEFLEQHAELKETNNNENMWDYRDKYEDVDDYEDEDEEYYDEEYDDYV